MQRPAPAYKQPFKQQPFAAKIKPPDPWDGQPITDQDRRILEFLNGHCRCQGACFSSDTQIAEACGIRSIVKVGHILDKLWKLKLIGFVGAQPDHLRAIIIRRGKR